jgi:hypothetical protein
MPLLAPEDIYIYIEPPVKTTGDDDDVEEDPNEKYEQMEESTLPEGFDAGEGEAWVGKLIVGPVPDPVPQTDDTQQPGGSGSESTAPQQPGASESESTATRQPGGWGSESTAPQQPGGSESESTACSATR